MFNQLLDVRRSCRNVLVAVRAGKVADDDLRAALGVSKSVETIVSSLQVEIANAIAKNDGSGENAGAMLLATETGKSKGVARRQVDTAKKTDEMPKVRESVFEGHLSTANAELLASAAVRTSSDAVNGDAGLLQRAERVPPDVLRAELERWVTRTQRDGGQAKQTKHYEKRSVTFWSKAGAVHMHGTFDREMGTRVQNSIEALADRLWREDGGRAKTGEAPKRTLEQRCADAVDKLAAGTASSGSSGRHNAKILVVTDIAAFGDDGIDPDAHMEIPGVGPIPPETLERLACNAEFTGILFDGPGKPLRHGENVRSATKAQFDALIARDSGCIGCHKKPQWCEAHHIKHFWKTKRTVVDELALVCHKCHKHIHDDHWQVIYDTHDSRHKLRPPNRAGPAERAQLLSV